MKICMISLGCDKNLADSEVMLGILHENGYTFTDNEEDAEIIIVNTCCFITDAKEESIKTILEMAKLKESGSLKVLIVTGCMAQRYKEEILTEIEEVDAIIGTTAFQEIHEVVLKTLGGEKSQSFQELNTLPQYEGDRIITTGGYYAYLKIAEGCDKHCTYCIIPKIRGNYRSVPMEKLLKEANNLVSRGIKEIILVAQETTLYGMDLYGEKTLPLLLKELCKINGLYWIRILYCYPEEITDELIKVIKEEDKVCKYLDIPIQHASNKILKHMGRKTTKEQLYDTIQKLRISIPEISLRTTLITGFPGETANDFEELYNFVDEMEFDRLGVFTYSPEEDTPAFLMEDQIDEAVKAERRDEIMQLQQEIAFEKAEAMIGQKLLVLIEGKLADENAYMARTYKDAPNVDGYIFINTHQELLSGDFAYVLVTGAAEYDLIGELIDESTE